MCVSFKYLVEYRTLLDWNGLVSSPLIVTSVSDHHGINQSVRRCVHQSTESSRTCLVQAMKSKHCLGIYSLRTVVSSSRDIGRRSGSLAALYPASRHGQRTTTSAHKDFPAVGRTAYASPEWRRGTLWRTPTVPFTGVQPDKDTQTDVTRDQLRAELQGLSNIETAKCSCASI